MSEIKKDFFDDRAKRLEQGCTIETAMNAENFLDHAVEEKYFYNSEWMGLPVIQFAEDLLALQEIIWNTKPTVILETGLAWGGSAVFYGSQLAQSRRGPYVMQTVISIEKGVMPGVSNEIIERLVPLRVRSAIIQGDSSDPDMLEKAKEYITPQDRVMVCLDSLHSAEHVRKEIELYKDLVTSGCYLVVFDTFVQHRTASLYDGKTCWPGNSPMDAMANGIEGFECDEEIDRKYLISSNPRGYWRKK